MTWSPLIAARNHPWVCPLLVGAVLRLVAAVAGHGYFASDDYLYVIRPAAQWLDDPGAPFPSEIRSILFPKVFAALMAVGHSLGLSDPASLLKWAYGLLGAWSLLTIPGVYALAAPRLGSRAATVAAWLCAAHPLMPRLTTRALIGVACMPALVWGLVCSERARAQTTGPWIAQSATGVGAGVLLGLAAMLRFQVGLILPVAAVSLLAPSSHAIASPGTSPRRLPALLGLFVGSLACAGLQAALDLTRHAEPLATPLRYLSYNLSHASKFGTSAWYTYVLLFVMLTLPPLTVVLLKPIGRACRRHPWVCGAFVVFVAVHSMVGHKEDRFMFPVLPLFFVLVGAALVDAYGKGRWSRHAVVFFVVCHLLVLPIVTVSDGQRNSTVPLLEVARSDSPPRYVHWVGKKKPPVYYLGGHSELMWTRQPGALPAAVAALPAVKTRVIFQNPPATETLDWLRAYALRCTDPTTYPGDLADRVVVAVNPRRNQRRRPMTVVDCDLGS